MSTKKNTLAGKPVEMKGSAKALLAGVGALRSKLELDRNDQGFTLREYAEKFGLKENCAESELKRLTQAGELIKGITYRADERGIRRRVNVYRTAKK
jgi:hypothetical protein